jgi:hypothetical protein
LSRAPHRPPDTLGPDTTAASRECHSAGRDQPPTLWSR